MKTIHPIITALIVAMVPITFINCEDLIPAGLETSVRGRVYDSVRQEIVSGAKVIVWRCRVSFHPGTVCSNVVDSVRTDKQGRFNVDFITQGNASQYKVAVFEDESFINASWEEVEAGRPNFISLYARELKHIRVEVQIGNNPVNQIYLRTASSNLARIYQRTRDTVIYGRVLPMAENELYFTTYDTSINQARRSVDVVNVDLRDTTHFLKKISDPKEWEIGQ